MAYFPNGSDGDIYHARYCERCVHWSDETGCPTWDLHNEWNYDAVGKDADKDKAFALELLWPRDGVYNADCRLFHEKGK